MVGRRVAAIRVCARNYAILLFCKLSGTEWARLYNDAVAECAANKRIALINQSAACDNNVADVASLVCIAPDQTAIPYGRQCVQIVQHTAFPFGLRAFCVAVVCTHEHLRPDGGVKRCYFFLSAIRLHNREQARSDPTQHAV